MTSTPTHKKPVFFGHSADWDTLPSLL